MPRGTNHEIITCAAPIEVLDNDVALQRIRILKIGDNYLRGHDFSVLISNEKAQEIIAASIVAIGAQDIPIDYDHQLEFSAIQGKGGRAPASGWIKKLSLEENDGIYADVEWTIPAAKSIQAKEYRYISPTLMVNKDTHEVAYIKNAGLTNQPAIDGLETLAASIGKNQTKEENMDLEPLALALGLSKDASFEQILEKAKSTVAIVVAASAAQIAVKENLGIDKDANLETITASINALKAKTGLKEGEVVVAASVITDLQKKVATIQGDRVTQVVAASIAAGKVAPGLKEWATDYAKKDLEGFEKFVAAAASFSGNQEITQKNDQGQFTALSPAQVAIAASLGVSNEDYMKTLNEEISVGAI